jgi:hypothetical protein
MHLAGSVQAFCSRLSGGDGCKSSRTSQASSIFVERNVPIFSMICIDLVSIETKGRLNTRSFNGS